MAESEIEWRAGDFETQERVLREGVETLDRLGDQFFYSTVALRLADCLLLRRPADDEEVAAICATARERTLAADLVNFLYLDQIEARRLAHQGDSAAAVQLARSAVETADTTDNYAVRGHAWASLAETLAFVGEGVEAGQAALDSISIHTAKGDVAGAAALESRFTEIGIIPA
jgi:hypothetical protein